MHGAWAKIILSKILGVYCTFVGGILLLYKDFIQYVLMYLVISSVLNSLNNKLRPYFTGVSIVNGVKSYVFVLPVEYILYFVSSIIYGRFMGLKHKL